MKTIIQLLAEELGCKEEYVNNVVTLLDEGNTIPLVPATARRRTVRWTTRRFGRSRQDSSICAICSSAGTR